MFRFILIGLFICLLLPNARQHGVSSFSHSQSGGRHHRQSILPILSRPSSILIQRSSSTTHHASPRTPISPCHMDGKWNRPAELLLSRLISRTKSSSSSPTAVASSSTTDASSDATKNIKPLFQLPVLSPWFTAILMLFAIQSVTAKAFLKAGIAFPASLGGCVLLLGVFLLTGSFGSSLYATLTPGASTLAQWLPVFFVPSLIGLPLRSGLGSASEYLKVGTVVVGGYLFSLLTTAWSVVLLQRDGSSSSDDDTSSAELLTTDEEDTTEAATITVISTSTSTTTITTPAAAAAAATPKKLPLPQPVFSSTMNLVNGAMLWGMLTIVLRRRIAAGDIYKGVTVMDMTKFQQLSETLCFIYTTLASFVGGTHLPKRITQTVHPLITCTLSTWFVMNVLHWAVPGTTFRTFLASYATPGSGAGSYLLAFLGPAVVSFACQMYDRRQLIRDNIREISVAIVTACTGGLIGTAAAVRCLGLGGGSAALHLSLLSRNITSPLAMAIAGILGADVSFAVSMVVVTGLIGANCSGPILDAVGIRTNKVARGLSVGAAAHGLGAASIANDADAFPFAAIAMVLTAVGSTSLVSIPIIKKLLIQLALGK